MPKIRLTGLAFVAVFAGSVAAGAALTAQESAQESDTAATSGKTDPLSDFSDIQREREAQDQSREQGGEADTDSATPAPPPDAELDEETQSALDMIAAVIEQLDPEAKRQGNSWELTVDEVQLLVVTDTSAGRMRILTPIAPSEDLPQEALLRLMQANFDTALDARYAIGQNLVWGTFIHSLPTLSSREFASGLLQTKSLRDTFGTTFSSGILSYGGGDSNAIITDQLEELLKQLERGEEI